MDRTLAELAEWVEGVVEGDGQTIIRGAAPQGMAGERDITLVDSASRADRSGQAAAAVAPPDADLGGLPVIRVADPHAAFAKIVASFHPPRNLDQPGVSRHAVVSPFARLGEGVTIHAGATVGDETELGAGCTIHAGVHIMPGCRIGPHTTIFPGAVLYENTVVGARCMIHAGVVLGAYGFGYRGGVDGHVRAAQLGHVVLEDDVEIGANSTVDRGTYGPTTIGEGTKLDNLVMIAHNCQIGRHNLICSQVGVAGSTTTGDHVVMGGQVGVRDHVHIGEGAVLAARAGVHTDIDPGADVIGSPAIRMRDFWLQVAHTAKLPEMRRTLRELRSELDVVRRQLETEQPAERRKAS